MECSASVASQVLGLPVSREDEASRGERERLAWRAEATVRLHIVEALQVVQRGRDVL